MNFKQHFIAFLFCFMLITILYWGLITKSSSSGYFGVKEFIYCIVISLGISFIMSKTVKFPEEK